MLLSVGSAPFGRAGLKFGSGGRRILRRFLVSVGAVLGSFAGGVLVTMAPSSAPFGGTFPLVGGRLCGRHRCTAPTGRTKQQGDRGWSSHPSGLAASPPTPFGLQPFPPDRGNRPSPRGRLCGRSRTRPYGGIGARPRCFCMGRSQTGPLGFVPGMLAGQSQAQERNRTSPNFCKPRAQWPGRNRGGHSDFARRK